MKRNYNSENKLNLKNYQNNKDFIKGVESKKENIFNSFDISNTKSKILPYKKFKREINKTTNTNENKEGSVSSKINSNKKFYNNFYNYHLSNKAFNTQTQRKKNINHQISNEFLPCNVITLSKKNGFNGKIILKNINNLKDVNKKQKYLRKCLSSPNNSKMKKQNLILSEDLNNNLMRKSPLDILVDKIALDYDIKLAHKKFSNNLILDRFFKKHFKNERESVWLNKYFYIKNKLNTNTKSSETKLKSNEKVLNFDNRKYKLFKSLSKNIKKHIKFSANKLDAKKIIEKIKKEENVENLAKINELKNVVEDEKILLTPKNFLKKKKDPFISYKTNNLVQKLNYNFTFKNRFILAKKFGIKLEKYLVKKDNN